MTTVTMNISLTEDLKSFVDSRIKARGYSSGSEYMRDLVRRDEERAKEERFKTLIQAGLESGPAGDLGKRLKAQIFRRASKRVANKLQKNPRTFAQSRLTPEASILSTARGSRFAECACVLSGVSWRQSG